MPLQHWLPGVPEVRCPNLSPLAVRRQGSRDRPTDGSGGGSAVHQSPGQAPAACCVCFQPLLPHPGSRCTGIAHTPFTRPSQFMDHETAKGGLRRGGELCGQAHCRHVQVDNCDYLDSSSHRRTTPCQTRQQCQGCRPRNPNPCAMPASWGCQQGHGCQRVFRTRTCCARRISLRAAVPNYRLRPISVLSGRASRPLIPRNPRLSKTDRPTH